MRGAISMGHRFVWKPENTSRSAGHNPNVRPTGQLAVFDGAAPGGRIASLSRAEVFFQRPEARPDGRRELASLYSPYWQSRLVAPTMADRLYRYTKTDWRWTEARHGRSQRDAAVLLTTSLHAATPLPPHVSADGPQQPVIYFECWINGRWRQVKVKTCRFAFR
jgi:hypothetical protein